MSYRDLRGDYGMSANPRLERAANEQFGSACRYANYLWVTGFPARAILALCRAIYLPPPAISPETTQPYAAYVWMLNRRDAVGFLGNPRVSFAHQAMRMKSASPLKPMRAWAMWQLTCAFRPDFAADNRHPEAAPCVHVVQSVLNDLGLPGEGDLWRIQFAHQPTPPGNPRVLIPPGAQ